MSQVSWFCNFFIGSLALPDNCEWSVLRTPGARKRAVGMWRGIAIGTSLALSIVGGAAGEEKRSGDMRIVPSRPAAYQPQPTSDGADYNGWEHYDPAKPVTLTGIVMSPGFSRGAGPRAFMR